MPACVTILSKQDLRDGHAFESREARDSYFYEHPWHLICQHQDEREVTITNELRNKTVNGIVPTIEYCKEKTENDYSLSENISLFIPSASLIKELNIRHSYTNELSFVNTSSDVIFKDPSVIEEGPSSALIRQDVFSNYLIKNKKVLVWRIGGDKTVSSSYSRNNDFPGMHVIRGVFYWDGNTIRGRTDTFIEQFDKKKNKTVLKRPNKGN
jgi:hypothetical protein